MDVKNLTAQDVKSIANDIDAALAIVRVNIAVLATISPIVTEENRHLQRARSEARALVRDEFRKLSEMVEKL
jgi:hypothetical protein